MGSHRWQVVPRHGFHADRDGRERVRCSNERQHTVRVGASEDPYQKQGLIPHDGLAQLGQICHRPTIEACSCTLSDAAGE